MQTLTCAYFFLQVVCLQSPRLEVQLWGSQPLRCGHSSKTQTGNKDLPSLWLCQLPKKTSGPVCRQRTENLESYYFLVNVIWGLSLLTQALKNIKWNIYIYKMRQGNCTHEIPTILPFRQDLLNFNTNWHAKVDMGNLTSPPPFDDGWDKEN